MTQGLLDRKRANTGPSLNTIDERPRERQGPAMPTKLFFDLDGTLTDSKPGMVRCVRYAFDRMNMTAPDESVIASLIGPPFHETLGPLFGSEEKGEQALAFYRERFADKGWRENSVYDGVPEALSELSKAGHDLYVATSKPLTFAEQIIEHFELSSFFIRVFGPTLDGALSNKVELLAYALSETQVDPKTSVMIGDRRHDIAGARGNGLGSIGVLYGYGSRAELTEAGADSLVDAPQDLIAATQQ